ncbi:hypothetical protein NVIE_015160 [Nitrososphaera viennensis EN76]|uniref:Uncharacterized protein n=1 Tax=Nitrososphaera viennensis EN76 TaxID=926571 RepID=A0A060HQE2_9ARCH|nr:hypothetical protein NVIE_015160 [Nitrososphaera viennensis EN76]
MAGAVAVAISLGIIFIAVFAFVFKPITALSNEQLITKSKQVKDVQYFLSKYPDAKVDIQRDFVEVIVSYKASKQLSEPSDTYPNGFIREIILATVYKNSADDPWPNFDFTVLEHQIH